MSTEEKPVEDVTAETPTDDEPAKEEGGPKEEEESTATFEPVVSSIYALR
jgi:hypothetical protein